MADPGTITRAAYDKLLSELALRMPVIVDGERVEVSLAGAMLAAGITVRDPDPAPPAVVRISRERFEAGVGSLLRAEPLTFCFRQGCEEAARGFLAAASIEVEPERTPEELLAELEAQRAAFVADMEPWFRCAPDGIQWMRPPHASGGMGDIILRHFPEVRRDGR